MKVHGKMLVKNFKSSFQEEFGVSIKVHRGMSTGHEADEDITIAANRSEGSTGDGHVELHGNMKVGTAEEEIAQSLGFKVQVLDASGSNAPNDATLGSLR